MTKTSSGAAINRAEHFNRSAASLTAVFDCFNRAESALTAAKQLLTNDRKE
jgi:hypothetical protein